MEVVWCDAISNTLTQPQAKIDSFFCLKLELFVPFVLSYVRISDAQKHLITKLFCPDFRQCLKTELFDNRRIIDAPKSERIRISALQ